MVKSKTVLHIIEILGAFVCAHHFWPKGVTYGEEEDWEKAQKHGHKSPSSSRHHSHRPRHRQRTTHGRGGSGDSGERTLRDYGREWEEEYEYDDRRRRDIGGRERRKSRMT